MDGNQTGGALPWVIFPRAAAVVSLVAVDHGGRTAEAVSIGAEGLIGPELADLPGFGHLQVQMPGPGWRIGTARLASLAGQSAALREALALAGRTLLVRVLQSAVCAALHPVEARASRWLLLAQDRTGNAELPVTQEMLAEMLGVRRTTVTRVIAQLAEKGLIRHRRSRVTVTDRVGLESAACGCHAGLLQRLRCVAPGLYPPVLVRRRLSPVFVPAGTGQERGSRARRLAPCLISGLLRVARTNRRLRRGRAGRPGRHNPWWDGAAATYKAVPAPVLLRLGRPPELPVGSEVADPPLPLPIAVAGRLRPGRAADLLHPHRRVAGRVAGWRRAGIAG